MNDYLIIGLFVFGYFWLCVLQLKVKQLMIIEKEYKEWMKK